MYFEAILRNGFFYNKQPVHALLIYMIKLACVFLIPFALQGQTWVKLSDFPSTKRDDGVAVSVGDKIFFGTGLQEGWAATIDFRVFDASNNSWSAIPDLPHTRERQYATAFAGNNCFYVFGGYGVGGVLNDLWKYDIGSGAWTAMSSKPGSGIAAAVCFKFGDKIIITSGECGNHYNREVWEYNISTNIWMQKNNVSWLPRRRAGGAVLNGYGYMACGIDSLYSFHKELYRYDPAADSWLKMPDIPINKGIGYASLQAASGKLLLFGGYDSNNVYYNHLWFYQPITGVWGQENSMPSFGRKGGMSAVANNVFYYSCGIDATNTRLTETWMLDVPLGLGKQASYSGTVKVYPCPASTVLKICLPDSNTNEPIVLKVISVLSTEPLMLTVACCDEFDLPLTNLPDGIYQLCIEQAGQSIVKKFVVAH